MRRQGRPLGSPLLVRVIGDREVAASANRVVNALGAGELANVVHARAHESTAARLDLRRQLADRAPRPALINEEPSIGTDRCPRTRIQLPGPDETPQSVKDWADEAVRTFGEHRVFVQHVEINPL